MWFNATWQGGDDTLRIYCMEEWNPMCTGTEGKVQELQKLKALWKTYLSHSVLVFIYSYVLVLTHCKNVKCKYVYTYVYSYTMFIYTSVLGSINDTFFVARVDSLWDACLMKTIDYKWWVVLNVLVHLDNPSGPNGFHHCRCEIEGLYL